LSSDTDIISDDFEEGRLPLPGGVRVKEQQSTSENIHEEEIIQNKLIEFYKYAIEKFAELKFNFGEALENNSNFNNSPYIVYIYVFLILFSLGIGVGLLRNNFKKTIDQKNIVDDSLVINENQTVFNEGLNQENKKEFINNSKVTFSEKIDQISFSVEELKTPSPSLEQIKYLLNTWLVNKSTLLAGIKEVDLSKIVKSDLINRLYEERQLDIKKGIYKNITTNIENIVFSTQTASRITVTVDMKYIEKIFKTDGELINETTFTPFLKVKYILGFSNNSWKLVDYISGV